MDTQAPHWDLNNTIALIYEAALEPSHWSVILKQLSCTLENAECSLVFMDDNLQNRSCLITSEGLQTLDLKAYSAKAFHKEFANSVMGDIVFLDKKPSIHSNTLIPPNTFPSLFASNSAKLFIPLLLGDSIGAVLIVELTQCQPLSASCMETLEQLSPHIVRAIHIHNHLSSLKHRNDSMLEALQRTNIPVFILNADLQVIFISREAEQLLTRQSALRVNAKKHLQLFFSEEQNTLIRLLNDFLAKGFHTQYWADQGIGLAIRHPDRLHPIRLCFLPIQKPDYQLPQLPFIAIFAFDPEQPRHIAPEYLKQAFNLTPTEIHVAQLLASGFNIAEIAEIRNTTLESTRWQMKQVLNKTHTHSQAELVRMLIVLGNDLNTDSQLLTQPPKNPANI